MGKHHKQISNTMGSMTLYLSEQVRDISTALQVLAGQIDTVEDGQQTSILTRQSLERDLKIFRHRVHELENERASLLSTVAQLKSENTVLDGLVSSLRTKNTRLLIAQQKGSSTEGLKLHDRSSDVLLHLSSQSSDDSQRSSLPCENSTERLQYTSSNESRTSMDRSALGEQSSNSSTDSEGQPRLIASNLVRHSQRACGKRGSIVFGKALLPQQEQSSPNSSASSSLEIEDLPNEMTLCSSDGTPMSTSSLSSEGNDEQKKPSSKLRHYLEALKRPCVPMDTASRDPKGQIYPTRKISPKGKLKLLSILEANRRLN